MKRKNKGILLGIWGTCCYGTNPLFALPLFAAGMTTDSVLFYRYGFALIIFGLWLTLHKKISLRISWRETAVLLPLGVIFAISSLTLYQSYIYIGAGIASTILFIYPILVALMMSAFFHEKISLRTIGAIILTTVGIGLFYEGKDGQPISLWGVVLVLISALAYAIYMVALKNVRLLKRVQYSKLTFYVMFFGLFVFFFAADFGTKIQPITTVFMLGCLLCSAVIPTIISLETMTIAIKLIGPTLSAVLGALEPVTAVFIGVLIFGEHLSLRIACGIVLILAAVMLIILSGQPKQKRSPTGIKRHKIG